MSNSYKKNPIGTYSNKKSNKFFKNISASKIRTKEREILSKVKKGYDAEDIIIPNEAELSSVWDWISHDGKYWFGKETEKWNKEDIEKFLRK